MTVLCGTCARPVHDNAFACVSCGTTLHEHLIRIIDGGLVDELDIALTRQARIGVGGRRGADVPLAYGHAASEAIYVLRNTLASWVRALDDDIRPVGPICQAYRNPPCRHHSCLLIAHRSAPEDALPAMAEWLARRVEVLRHMPEGPDAVDELIAAIRNAERATNRPGDAQYVGPCTAAADGLECGADLYAPPEAAWVHCRHCGTSYRVHQRRTWLLAQAENQLGTATEISRAATSLGRQVTPELIRQWARRGRLTARGIKEVGARRWRTYRLGDVLDLLGEDAARLAQTAR